MGVKQRTLDHVWHQIVTQIKTRWSLKDVIVYSRQVMYVQAGVEIRWGKLLTFCDLTGWEICHGFRHSEFRFVATVFMLYSYYHGKYIYTFKQIQIDKTFIKFHVRFISWTMDTLTLQIGLIYCFLLFVHFYYQRSYLHFI